MKLKVFSQIENKLQLSSRSFKRDKKIFSIGKAELGCTVKQIPNGETSDESLQTDIREWSYHWKPLKKQDKLTINDSVYPLSNSGLNRTGAEDYRKH